MVWSEPILYYLVTVQLHSDEAPLSDISAPSVEPFTVSPIPNPMDHSSIQSSGPHISLTDGAQLEGHVGGAGGGGGARSGGGGGGNHSSRGTSPLFHLPAEFFHPARAVSQGSPAAGRGPADRIGSLLTSPASWASLRSPGANSRVIGSQVSQ